MGNRLIQALLITLSLKLLLSMVTVPNLVAKGAIATKDEINLITALANVLDHL